MMPEAVIAALMLAFVAACAVWGVVYSVLVVVSVLVTVFATAASAAMIWTTTPAGRAYRAKLIERQRLQLAR